LGTEAGADVLEDSGETEVKAMTIQIGDRVGAILSVKDGKVLSLGFGTYAGLSVPPDRGPRSLATLMHEAKAANPRIVLDSGKEVFGCECWWGSEGVMLEKLDYWKAQGWEIADVDIDERLGETSGERP